MKKTVNYLAILSFFVLGATLAHADGHDGHHLKPYPSDSGNSSASSAPSSPSKSSCGGGASSDYYKTCPLDNRPISDPGYAVIKPK